MDKVADNAGKGDQMDKVKAAFNRGWHETVLGLGLDTYRKVSEAYPEYSDEEIQVYLNGGDDARHGRRFRLDND